MKKLALTSRGADAARGAGGVGGGTGGMQTAVMRELERLKSARSYSHAVIRVRLPGELVMQVRAAHMPMRVHLPRHRAHTSYTRPVHTACMRPCGVGVLPPA